MSILVLALILLGVACAVVYIGERWAPGDPGIKRVIIFIILCLLLLFFCDQVFGWGSLNVRVVR